jgi:SAM-dependent methyltransferase
METSATPRLQYALGHSEHELARLRRQGRAVEAFTAQLFEQAGIGPDMRVLDVGSGAGDVSLLVAGLVGPNGKVVGVDCVEKAIEHGTARAQLREIKNLEFLLGDPTLMEFHQQFDAVIGRFVLMYYPDPADTVRRLARHLRPGGLMVFQEFDMDYLRSCPTAPIFERTVGWIRQAFSASGAGIRLGFELHHLFVAAGLPSPSMRFDALIGGRAELEVYDLIAETVQSLLPVMEKTGIATAADVELPTLADRIRKEVIANGAVVLSPAVIGAWSRK